MRAHWHQVREWFRSHPTHADALLAVGFLCIVIPTGLLSELDPDARRPDVWWVLLEVLVVAPVALRRRWPIPALAVSAAGVLAILGFGYPDAGGAIATVVVAYSAAAYGPPRQARWAVGALLSVLALFFYLGRLRDEPGATLGNLIGNYAIFGTAWVIGDAVRRRRERVTELEREAARLTRERGLLAREAVGQERAAIARELHDVVAHAVSVMTIQAGAARRIAATDPARAAEALAVIEQTGREALQELRRVVGVLRAGEEVVAADLGPQPTLAHLGDLVTADPGLDVRLHVEGRPASVPASLDVSAYRIVQEALTNVRKHAGPDPQAEVWVRYGPDLLEVEVLDDGRGAAADRSPEGGHGLVGMRERVALAGGSLDAGPRAGGGWRVRARLPLDPVSA